MFESLSDRIRDDEQVTTRERVSRAVVVSLLSVVLFGALYVAVNSLQ